MQGNMGAIANDISPVKKLAMGAKLLLTKVNKSEIPPEVKFAETIQALQKSFNSPDCFEAFRSMHRLMYTTKGTVDGVLEAALIGQINHTELLPPMLGSLYQPGSNTLPPFPVLGSFQSDQPLHRSSEAVEEQLAAAGKVISDMQNAHMEKMGTLWKQTTKAELPLNYIPTATPKEFEEFIKANVPAVFSVAAKERGIGPAELGYVVAKSAGADDARSTEGAADGAGQAAIGDHLEAGI